MRLVAHVDGVKDGIGIPIGRGGVVTRAAEARSIEAQIGANCPVRVVVEQIHILCVTSQAAKIFLTILHQVEQVG